VGCGVFPILGGQLPNFQEKSLNFPTQQSNGWHFLISKRPKDISQQCF
jgi:hypothetical protein